MADDRNKQLFLSLIYSFQMQTMMQLGKLANPMSGTIEKELDGAQVTIDMLDMLKAKSKGNISDDETKFLDQVIADLKLNYVEERDKEKSGADKTIDSSKSVAHEGSSAEESDKTGDENKKGSTPKNNSGEKPLTEKEMDSQEPVPPQE